MKGAPLCSRNHPRTATSNGTCQECKRALARLLMRVKRVKLTLARHDAHCPLNRAICARHRALVTRLAMRQRALEAWRDLGSQVRVA